MDSKDFIRENSEKAAIKRLIEISQKENYFNSSNSDNELDSWVYSNSKVNSKPSSSSSKPLSSRPSTSLGKPPRTKKSDQRPLNKPDLPQPRNVQIKRISLVAPITQSYYLNPSVQLNLKNRSSSLKSERLASNALLERTQTNDIGFTFKRKMIKYKLLRQAIDKEKREGVSLISFPKFIL